MCEFVLLLMCAMCYLFTPPVCRAINNDYIREETLQDGYFLDPLGEVIDQVDNAQFSDGPEVLECPSPNVITTRYKCSVNGEWVDCSRKQCCKDYTFIAGRCVLKDEDPCSMNLCEQQCTVYLQRVICTCYDGYKFHPENQRNGIKPFCVDVNECLVNNGDCEHECINEDGGHRCICKPGFVQREDNRTCASERELQDEVEDVDRSLMVAAEAAMDRKRNNATELPARRDRCYASCDSVSRLHDKLKVLSEKVSALSTAIRLASFASGPPGPAGPPGPPGQPGPRGFPGPEGSNNNGVLDAADNEGRTYGAMGANSNSQDQAATNAGGGLSQNTRDYTYSILDAFVPLPSDETTHCRCKRGPQGPPGAPGAIGPQGLSGERGPRGQKGPRGSFDFLLLVLADLRHDMQQLQHKVFDIGEKPSKFDIHGALEQHRMKSKQKLLKQYKSLEVFGTAAVMEMNVGNSVDGNGLSDRQTANKSANKDIAHTTTVSPTTIATTSTTASTSTTSSNSATEMTVDTTTTTPNVANQSRDPTDDYEDTGEDEDASGEMTYEDYL